MQRNLTTEIQYKLWAIFGFHYKCNGNTFISITTIQLLHPFVWSAETINNMTVYTTFIIEVLILNLFYFYSTLFYSITYYSVLFYSILVPQDSTICTCWNFSIYNQSRLCFIVCKTHSLAPSAYIIIFF